MTAVNDHQVLPMSREINCYPCPEKRQVTRATDLCTSSGLSFQLAAACTSAGEVVHETVTRATDLCTSSV
jgi:hypothetical protein